MTNSATAPAVSPLNDTISSTPAYDPSITTPQTRARALAAGALGTPSIGPGAADFEMRECASKDYTLGAAANDNGAAGSDAPADDEPGSAVKQAGGKDLFSSANMSLLRWAAFFFWVRNFLDTLDGVVARVQRHRAGIVVTSTSFGFNGHVLDMVTDTAGVTFINVAIFVFLSSKNLALARVPSALLLRFGFRAHLQKSQLVPRAIAFIGLCMVGFLGLCWETTMLRYSNLFDAHANTDPDLFVLDNNFQVRLTQFLWALTCGDMVLVYIILAICFNKMWECTQAMFFLGYPWMLILSMYCSYVWHRVVLADPAAARIVAQNPDLFF
uniref:Uncharacterized protein n=1 Tax=Neobodo designis TaxID=312471 RepID=A0A7S1R0Y6_NEODS|mmetsp:Transcript_5838/g.18401  ORF Transcript_5838/g.18401 Transcript_5838/m.18401 type:complete len:327 (+) Transcript_5838:2-982(+)